MRDIIHSVMVAEAEAKGIVAAAWTEAERISAEAQMSSQDLVARTQREARAEAGQTVALAVKEAEKEKADQLARWAAEIEAEIRLDEDARRCAVAAAVRCVCGLP